MSDGAKERGLCELYEEDPERADYLVFGRIAESDRRGFLRGAGLAAMSAAVGASIPFHRNMPAGLIPSALADETTDFKLAGKDGLTVLNDRPINAETPPHLLDDEVTPNERFFVRNNGTVPEMAEKMDATGWSLTVDGETFLLNAGDVLAIPGNAVHSGQAHTACRILDVFSPVREEYR